jgi:phosphotriesterase-related protein
MNRNRIELLNTSTEIDRRSLLKTGAAFVASGLAAGLLSTTVQAAPQSGMVHTVLGPVAPEKLGVTLMHEHAPIVEWSELYEAPPGPVEPVREAMLAKTAAFLEKFHQSTSRYAGPGAIVECTPIRTGRYPQLMVELARRTPVQIVACTGFWCEAAAPMHPWAVSLASQPNGVKKIAELYIQEITQGMEDPAGKWGERFTSVKAGMIKCATSEFLRPHEKRCHEAAGIASRETGCPITTHTTRGGGLEEAQVLLKAGADPAKICIGHQGDKDDRRTPEAHEYHRQIAALGCNVQFDRVGLSGSYSSEKIARQIKHLVDSGHTKQILVGHDLVPYFYENYTATKKSAEGWKVEDCDFTIVTTKLTKALTDIGVSEQDIRTILIENPRRVLAF